MAEVAARAGVAAGTVYKHFAGKVELVAEVFRTLVAPRGRGGARPPRPHGTALERSAAVDRDLRRSRAEAPAPRVRPARRTGRPGRRRAAPGVPARVPRRHRRRRSPTACATGELPPQNAELVAAALVGAIGEALVGPLADGIETPRHRPHPDPVRPPRHRRSRPCPPMRSPTRSRRSSATTSPPIRPCVEGLQREGAGWAARRGHRARPARQHRALAADRAAGQRPPAGAAHARPLRQPRRRGRVPAAVPRPDAHGRRARPARRPVGRRPRRARTSPARRR